MTEMDREKFMDRLDPIIAGCIGKYMEIYVSKEASNDWRDKHRVLWSKHEHTPSREVAGYIYDNLKMSE